MKFDDALKLLKQRSTNTPAENPLLEILGVNMTELSDKWEKWAVPALRKVDTRVKSDPYKYMAISAGVAAVVGFAISKGSNHQRNIWS